MHTGHPAGHAQAFAHRLGMGGKGVGTGLQAVVHMQGLHAPRPQRMGRQQQGRGIGPATEGHGPAWRQAQGWG
jgi:hypothetical protein